MQRAPLKKGDFFGGQFVEQKLGLSCSLGVTKFATLKVFNLVTLFVIFFLPVPAAVGEVGLLTSKSDLSSTTKCDQNHASSIYKFGHT